MQKRHLHGMMLAGRHITWITNSMQDFFKEVREDLSMSGSMEATLPHPPNLSQLYLPFCEGREILQDAATPHNSDDDGSSDGAITDTPGTPEASQRVKSVAMVNLGGGKAQRIE